jgi:ribose transport system substrate-binding protein
MYDKNANELAAMHTVEFSFEERNADDEVDKQISDINELVAKKPKVLLVSPVSDAVAGAISKAHDDGAYVILLDRKVPGDKWDGYVGGDSKEIGRQAASYIAKGLNGKGTVLLIPAKETKDRGEGFLEAIKTYPNVKVIVGDDCDGDNARAQSFVNKYLQTGKPFDAIYAEDDHMAIGACVALEAVKAPKKIIVGSGAYQRAVIDYIKQRRIDATFTCPEPGSEGVDIAAGFLNGHKLAHKEIILPTELVTRRNVISYLVRHPNLSR